MLRLCDRLLQSQKVAYYEKRDFERHLADQTQAIKLNPNYAETFHDRGIRYYDKKLIMDLLIPESDVAIKIVPNYPIAFNNQGSSYESKREENRVIQEVDQAIKINPAQAIASYNRGNILFATRDYSGAIKQYHQVIALQPANADAWTNRCGARTLGGSDLQAALGDCNEAIKLRANNGPAFDNRGFVHRLIVWLSSVCSPSGTVTRRGSKGDCPARSSTAHLAVPIGTR